jgi:hypothetical protein
MKTNRSSCWHLPADTLRRIAAVFVMSGIIALYMVGTGQAATSHKGWLGKPDLKSYFHHDPFLPYMGASITLESQPKCLPVGKAFFNGSYKAYRAWNCQGEAFTMDMTDHFVTFTISAGAIVPRISHVKIVP